MSRAPDQFQHYANNQAGKQARKSPALHLGEKVFADLHVKPPYRHYSKNATCNRAQQRRYGKPVDPGIVLLYLTHGARL
jgi:hypothetical protein